MKVMTGVTGILALLLSVTAWQSALTAADDVGTGFSLHGLKYTGPGEWRHSAEPIWTYDYHKLRLRYRATGIAKDESGVLTLRPGAVGPVTRGATNWENPFAAGLPVIVLRGADLTADGEPHTAEIELRGVIKTGRIDQLQFALPAGAVLTIDELEFRGDPGVFACDSAAAPPLPAGTVKLAVKGALACGAAAATSLRGRESINVEVAGKKAATLYLSLMAHFAGLTSREPVADVDLWRIKESHDPAFMVARIRYAGGPRGEIEDEQYPFLVAERRHALLNRKAAVYGLRLDPHRAVTSVELLDRSPQAQLAVFAAGLSNDALPEAIDEPLPPAPPRSAAAAGRPVIDSSSSWFGVATANGKPLPAGVIEPDLRVAETPSERTLSLSLKNTSGSTIEFDLAFPSLQVQPSNDARDVYYLFPCPGAVISRNDSAMERPYSNQFPLQFVDVFSPGANRGVALVVNDTAGNSKTFRVKKTGASVAVEVLHHVQLAPGETYSPPGAILSFHNGDWRRGFDAYRAWLKTWYKPAGPRAEWLRSSFWARRDYPIGGSGTLFDDRNNRYTFDRLIADGKAFGGIDFIDISGWALSETKGRVGDYPIELGGAADLRRNIELARAAGIPTGLYFEGRLIDRNSDVGRAHGKEWQSIDETGQGRVWAGGSPEIWICPHVPAWRNYLATRIATVARETGAAAVYLDGYGFSIPSMWCHAHNHGHRPGIATMPGEIAMAAEVRKALAARGLRDVSLYLEAPPPDAMAPYFDAVLAGSVSKAALSPLKLNLWRFAFPDVRVWEMLSFAVQPRVLSPENFRLSLWHGNGAWLKGHSDTWYGEDLLVFIRRAHGLLKQHAAAISGVADPLVDSPHPAVFINRFRGGEETVYTLFNASYRTVRFSFQGRERTLGPRDVDLVAAAVHGSR